MWYKSFHITSRAHYCLSLQSLGDSYCMRCIKLGSTFINEPLILFHFRTLERYKKFNFSGHTVRLFGQKKEGGRKTGGAPLLLPKIRKNPLIEIIPINTGCLNQCTYCKTKHARGELGSYPPGMWTFRTVDTLLGHRKKSHRSVASTYPLSCDSYSPPIISPFCSYECSDKFHFWQVLWAGWCKQTGLKENTTAGRKNGKPQVPSSPQSEGFLSLAST